MIVRNVAEEAKNRREEMIQRIKDCGQYIIDNAETILGEEKYMRELYVTCNFFDRSEPPYITINKDVIPDSFIERIQNRDFISKISEKEVKKHESLQRKTVFSF